MVWWISCFAATVGTIVAKWYFTTAIERLRQSLLREQREALSLKGRSRLIREREVDIKRLKTTIASHQREILGLEDELKNG